VEWYVFKAADLQTAHKKADAKRYFYLYISILRCPVLLSCCDICGTSKKWSLPQLKAHMHECAKDHPQFFIAYIDKLAEEVKWEKLK